MPACALEWRAPRADVKHSTIPVNHVCMLEKEHSPNEHECICGTKATVFNKEVHL